MNNKKLLIFVTALILTLSTVLLAACFGGDDVDGTPGLYYWENDDGQSYTVGLSGSSTLTESNLVIPSKYKGKPVNALSNRAFENTDIVSVTIPDSITEIAECAFENCTKLKTINWSKNIKTIARSAFEGCNSLESVDIPAGTTLIGASAFEGCTALTTVNFNSSLTTIGNGAFSDCQALKTLELPENVVEIQENAFDNCTALESVVVKGNANVGNFVFNNCTALNSVEFVGKDTLVLGYSVFDRSGIKSLTMLAESVTFESTTFSTRNNLEKITANVNTVSNENFQLTNIKELVLTDGEEVTQKIFNKNGDFNNLTSLTLPANLKRISLNNSMGFIAKNLKNVYFSGTLADWCAIDFNNNNPISVSNSTLYIDNKAIEGEVTIPSEVESISDYAFYNYRKINKLIIEEGVTSIGASAFAGNYNLLQVTLPKSLTTLKTYAFNSDYKIVQIINYSDISEEALENSIYTDISEEFQIISDENDAYSIEKIDDFIFIKTNSEYTPYIMMHYVGSSSSVTIPNDVNGEEFYIHPYAFTYTQGVKEISFANAEGWVCQDRNYPAVSDLDLTNPTNNAYYLMEQYDYYSWYRI